MKLVPDYERPTMSQKAGADLALLLLRLPIGVTFLLAGLGKVTGGVANFVNDSAKAIPAFLPESLGRASLWCVPWAELTVGVCLILGLLTRVFGLIATLMLISFIIAATGVWAYKPGGPLNFNVMYASLTLALALLGPGRISLDTLLFRGGGSHASRGGGEK